jgi:hypothetical protein
MKNILVLIVAMFAFTSTAVMAEAPSAFDIQMKDAGFRWTQDADAMNDFWSGSQDTNSLRLFTSAYVGTAKVHEMTLMYNRGDMSGPWDIFEGTDQHMENVALEYRYNFK